MFFPNAPTAKYLRRIKHFHGKQNALTSNRHHKTKQQKYIKRTVITQWRIFQDFFWAKYACWLFLWLHFKWCIQGREKISAASKLFTKKWQERLWLFRPSIRWSKYTFPSKNSPSL